MKELLESLVKSPRWVYLLPLIVASYQFLQNSLKGYILLIVLIISSAHQAAISVTEYELRNMASKNNPWEVTVYQNLSKKPRLISIILSLLLIPLTIAYLYKIPRDIYLNILFISLLFGSAYLLFKLWFIWYRLSIKQIVSKLKREK